jgi:hypothetical protein
VREPSRAELDLVEGVRRVSEQLLVIAHIEEDGRAVAAVDRIRRLAPVRDLAALGRAHEQHDRVLERLIVKGSGEAVGQKTAAVLNGFHALTILEREGAG